MRTLIGRFCRDDLGAAAVEYGLIAAGMSVAIITLLQGIGIRLSTGFDSGH